MSHDIYHKLATAGVANELLSDEIYLRILSDPSVDLLPLLNAAYTVRRHFTGKEVSLHILNNAANGFCPEDCQYCAQAKTSTADIKEYPMKSEEEILAEAQAAYERGAFRYCMVFAGRGPSDRRTEKLAGIIRKIKKAYPLEVCVSAGLLDEAKAQTLKAAGLDRLNHNLNTSEEHYTRICTTHTYADRLRTLDAAQKAGLSVCSGIIVGLGETPAEMIEVAHTLRRYAARSIPVNFLVNISGKELPSQAVPLTPEYCLRALCLFRFLNPDAEVRVAAGREIHFRSMEVMSLYPANSLFLQGYLNARGSGNMETLRMIKDAGFTVKSDHDIDELLAASASSTVPETADGRQDKSCSLKSLTELRPYASSR